MKTNRLHVPSSKTTKNKEELAAKLFKLLRGVDNFQKLVLAHDTARIVQCLLKYSPVEVRTEIAGYLIAKVPEMSISKYAHFCVLRLIKYGTADIKAKVIDAMMGNVLRLCNNKFASEIIDSIYVSWANSQQKAFLRQEWYGDLYKKVGFVVWGDSTAIEIAIKYGKYIQFNIKHFYFSPKMPPSSRSPTRTPRRRTSRWPS